MSKAKFGDDHLFAVVVSQKILQRSDWFLFEMQHGDDMDSGQFSYHTETN